MLLNDGTTSNEERLGAIGDLDFALSHLSVEDHLLVLAADNLLTFSLRPMVDHFHREQALVLAVRHNPDREDQKRRGVVSLEGNRVTNFQEKPVDPSSDYAAAPIYAVPVTLLPRIRQYVAEGRNLDAPGYLMEYLVEQSGATAWHLPGEVIDVGHPTTYRQAQETFREP